MKFSVSVAVVALALVSAGTASAHGAHQQESAVYEIPGPLGAPIDGASASVTRTQSGAAMTIHTSGFGDHHAVTVWVFSFSHPENCEFGGVLPDGRDRLCGFGDDAVAATGPQLQQLTGHVGGASGNANFGGRIVVENPLGAEFHVVLADHGPLDPSALPGLIKSGATGSQIAFFIP